MEKVLRTTFLVVLKYEQLNTQIMENKEEKILNRLYQQLTEIYYLKSVCLEILKELEQKAEPTEKEQYWKKELLKVLFESEGI